MSGLQKFDLSNVASVDDLDQEDVVEDIDRPEGEEEDQEEAEDQEEDGPVAFTFGEEEPSEEEEPEKPSKLRKIISEQDREIKRLRAMSEPKVEIADPGPRPRLEDFDWDQDAHDAALDKWLDDKQAAKDQQAAVERAAEERNRQGNKILSDYQARAKTFSQEHRINDYEDAFGSVESELGPEKVSYIIAGFPKAEELIYALHLNPSKMRALNAIENNPARFIYEAAMLQKDIKVRQGRKAPPADTPIRGNGGGNTGDRKLASLEDRARKTGDRSALIAYKREKGI